MRLQPVSVSMMHARVHVVGAKSPALYALVYVPHR